MFFSSSFFRNGQTKLDYLIGLRSGDIGDYTSPSERTYSQIFNQTGLQTLVYVRYFPQLNPSNPNSNDQRTNGRFYYRVGPFFGVRKEKKQLLIVRFRLVSVALVDHFDSRRCDFNNSFDYFSSLLSLFSTTVRQQLVFSSYLL